MTLTQAIAVARLGSNVRRDAWALSRTIGFLAGGGERRAVCIASDGTESHVLRASDLTTADRDAVDYRVATE